jgi:peptidoglycan/LPS O-acetylase OafA/YrhL
VSSRASQTVYSVTISDSVNLNNTPTHEQTRFRTLDGIRGIAAIAVVLYHLAKAVDRAAASDWLPSWIRLVIDHGYLGVDLFFVLSGFVIAYSTREGNYTLGYLGRFALRRSIRLDPPYWFTIIAEITVVALTLRFFTSAAPELPSIQQIAAHLIYAQNILGQGDILPIFWTLCYEIQFYLAFVLMLVVWQRFGNGKPILPVLALAAFFVISLIVRYSALKSPLPGLAIDRWFQFFLGVLTWWTVSRRVSIRVLALACTVTLTVALADGHGFEQVVGVAGCVVIAYAGIQNKMGSMLAGRTTQFLGKISYSLYLVHLIVGWRLVALADSMLPPLGTSAAWGLFLTGVVASVGAAVIMWRWIELPTIAFSKRVALRRQSSSPAPMPKPVAALVAHDSLK